MDENKSQQDADRLWQRARFNNRSDQSAGKQFRFLSIVNLYITLLFTVICYAIAVGLEYKELISIPAIYHWVLIALLIIFAVLLVKKHLNRSV
ncbi:MAG: hypothetical protein KDD94_01445 [Calditrichaeota bacterium]|nr:hypothetical protein [Calditrichota bacterium]